MLWPDNQTVFYQLKKAQSLIKEPHADTGMHKKHFNMRYSLDVCSSHEPLDLRVDLTHVHAQTARV